MATRLTEKALKNDLSFVENQLRLYSDPYDTVGLMWRRRLEAIQKDMEGLEKSPRSHAEVALMFDGAPVHGSEEIKLGFATKMLDQYQMLIGTFAAEIGGAVLAARGQLPKSFSSKLYIKDMLRGSVGFLLQEPEPAQKSLVRSLLNEAVEAATSTLNDLSSADPLRVEASLDALSPRAISATKKLIKSLHDAGAEIKIVGTENEIELNRSKLSTINERLNESELVESSETLEGMLLGLFPDRQQYEFKIGADGPVIYGPVSEDLDEQYLSSPAMILLKPSVATFNVVTRVRAGQTVSQQKVLERINLLATASTPHT